MKLFTELSLQTIGGQRCLRIEDRTREIPLKTSTFVVPQPIPVETPVTTTSLPFAIAFLLIKDTVHLTFLACNRAHLVLRRASRTGPISLQILGLIGRSNKMEAP